MGYQVVNTFAFLFNCYGKVLPTIATVTLYTSLVSFFVILVVVPSKAPSHQDAKFVFATFINNTGWASGGIAFIVGLINTNWAFACLDCATHMAEEVARPEKMIPIAIMGTVAIGFVTAWFYSVAMFFSLNNFDDVLNTPTLVPILELFNQALVNKAGAIVLESLIIATGIGCQIASHTWQSRLCWSFARDKGLPGGKYLSHVHPKLDVPLQAHFVSCVVVAVLGCLYLGSSTAFNRYVKLASLQNESCGSTPSTRESTLASLGSDLGSNANTPKTQHDHGVHRPALHFLRHPRRLPPDQRPQQHQARPLLARPHRSLRQLRPLVLDPLYVDHVLFPTGPAGKSEQYVFLSLLFPPLFSAIGFFAYPSLVLSDTSPPLFL